MNPCEPSVAHQLNRIAESLETIEMLMALQVMASNTTNKSIINKAMIDVARIIEQKYPDKNK